MSATIKVKKGPRGYYVDKDYLEGKEAKIADPEKVTKKRQKLVLCAGSADPAVVIPLDFVKPIRFKDIFDDDHCIWFNEARDIYSITRGCNHIVDEVEIEADSVVWSVICRKEHACVAG